MCPLASIKGCDVSKEKNKTLFEASEKDREGKKHFFSCQHDGLVSLMRAGNRTINSQDFDMSAKDLSESSLGLMFILQWCTGE